MTTVTVVDKTPPVASAPDDIEVFCDGAQYGRAEDICSSSPDKEKNLSDFDCLDLKGQPYFEVECKKENDLDLQDAVDANGLAFGYYSCYNGSLQAHDQDNHSSCDPGPGVLSTAIGGYVKTNMINRFLKSPICFQSLTMELLTTNLMGI